MGKYDFLGTENVVPVKKQLKLKYEVGYNNVEKEIIIGIYPYKVEEKLELQNIYKKAQKLIKTKDTEKLIEAEELLLDASNKSAFFVLRKDDPDITMELVQKMPRSWIDEIATAALEFEGLTKEMIEQQRKKAIDEFQK